MPVFDISRNILTPDTEYDSYDYLNRSGNRDRMSRMNTIIDWMNENVGEYYGRGGLRDENCNIHIGSGWEIFHTFNNKREQPNPDMDAEVKWYVDITDEQKAMLFALKWSR